MLDRFEVSMIIRSESLSNDDLAEAMGVKSAAGYYASARAKEGLSGFWVFSSGIKSRAPIIQHIQQLVIWLGLNQSLLSNLQDRVKLAVLLVVYRDYWNVGFELSTDGAKMLSEMRLPVIVRFVLGGQMDVPRDVSDILLD